MALSVGFADLLCKAGQWFPRSKTQSPGKRTCDSSVAMEACARIPPKPGPAEV